MFSTHQGVVSFLLFMETEKNLQITSNPKRGQWGGKNWESWKHRTYQHRVFPLGGKQRHNTWRGHDLKGGRAAWMTRQTTTGRNKGQYQQLQQCQHLNTNALMSAKAQRVPLSHTRLHSILTTFSDKDFVSRHGPRCTQCCVLFALQTNVGHYSQSTALMGLQRARTDWILRRVSNRGSISHQSSPHRCPGGTQRGILAENSVHEPTHHTKTSTSHLEDPEDQYALLVENEVPVSVHLQVLTGRKVPC